MKKLKAPVPLSILLSLVSLRDCVSSSTWRLQQRRDLGANQQVQAGEEQIPSPGSLGSLGSLALILPPQDTLGSPNLGPFPGQGGPGMAQSRNSPLDTPKCGVG